MNENDKLLGRRVVDAISVLPDKAQEYMIGYAEGVIAGRNSVQVGVTRPAAKCGV